jgi:hypothetical protein
MSLRSDQKILMAAVFISALLWAIPYGSFALYPLGLLNTHIHELCHALAAIGTGGEVQHIVVNADLSGLTPVHGRSILLAASAGYVGSTIVGALMILASRTEKGARGMLWTSCAFIGLSALLFVRMPADQPSSWVGVASGILWTGAFVLMAKKLKGDWPAFAAQFIGVQLCLSSLWSFSALMSVAAVGGHSDALIMQEHTGLPAFFWASTWLIIALAAIGFSLRAVWRHPKERRASSDS